MTSKYNGKCKSCGGKIFAGDRINWSRETGAIHENCEIKIGGKTLQELSAEWEKEHAGQPTALERFENMRVSRDWQGVPEDALWTYAMQDSPRNPYKQALQAQLRGKEIINCNEHGTVEATEWDGRKVCPYHQHQKQTEEGVVMMYDEFNQDGEAY